MEVIMEAIMEATMVTTDIMATNQKMREIKNEHSETRGRYSVGA